MLTIPLIIVVIVLQTGGGFGYRRRGRRGGWNQRNDPVGRHRRRRRPSALIVDLSAALKEAAERAGERRDHGDRVELDEHVEDSSADQDRILDLCEETVSIWVVVQNAALPNVWISVCWEWRSSRNAAIAQRRSAPTVATMIVTSWSRSRRCVAVAARSTSPNSPAADLSTPSDIGQSWPGAPDVSASGSAAALRGSQPRAGAPTGVLGDAVGLGVSTTQGQP